VARLERRGAEVRIIKADLGREEEVERVLAEVARELPPLRGIFHAAAVLNDAMSEMIDRERYEVVLRPKMMAALYLDWHTRHMDLDHFVLFSSIVGEIGNAGQVSYAAANSYLDALAHQRRARGKKALSVAWGALGGAGMLARDPRVAEHLRRQGLRPVPVDDALEILGRLMVHPDLPAQVAVADVDWTVMGRAVPQVTRSPLLEELIGPAGKNVASGTEEPQWRELLEKLPAEERIACCERLVSAVVAKVLGIDPRKLERNRRLDQLGVDSLMAVELQAEIGALSGIELSAMDLMQGNSVAKLARLCLARYDGERTGRQAA
jgi:acyl carrier protein/NAD(P)-dependent dehydrogenase (short-subunit alcohol dehydrogenase family)